MFLKIKNSIIFNIIKKSFFLHKKRLAFFCVLSILLSFLPLFPSYILKFIMDNIAAHPFDKKDFFLICLYVISLLIVESSPEIKRILFFPIFTNTIYKVSSKYFKEVIGYVSSSMNNGIILGALAQAQRSLPALFAGLIFFIIPTLIEITIVFFVFYFKYNMVYGILLFLLFIFYNLNIIFNLKTPINAQKKLNSSHNNYLDFLIDNLNNKEEIFYNNITDRQVRISDRLLQDRALSEFIFLNKMEYFLLNQKIIIFLIFSIIISYSYLNLIAGIITSGDFILINSYLMQVTKPFSHFSFIWRDIQKSVTDLKLVENILSKIPSVNNHHIKQSSIGSLEFKNISFRYKNSKLLLNNLNFKLKKNTLNIIIGPSGSGKSTILKIILKLVTPQKGRVIVGGIPADSLSDNNLRKLFSIVPQKISFLNESIKNNLLLSKTKNKRTKELFLKLCKEFFVDDFVRKNSRKYQAVINKNFKPSGGEAQRLAIVRALLRETDYLLLDEFSSAMDANLAQNILKKILEIRCQKTILLITHDKDILPYADNIIFLENGKVQCEGTHKDLLLNSEKYKSFVNSFNS
jgi:ATP-binding cassette subfamily B protein